MELDDVAAMPEPAPTPGTRHKSAIPAPSDGSPTPAFTHTPAPRRSRRVARVKCAQAVPEAPAGGESPDGTADAACTKDQDEVLLNLRELAQDCTNEFLDANTEDVHEDLQRFMQVRRLKLIGHRAHVQLFQPLIQNGTAFMWTGTSFGAQVAHLETHAAQPDTCCERMQMMHIKAADEEEAQEESPRERGGDRDAAAEEDLEVLAALAALECGEAQAFMRAHGAPEAMDDATTEDDPKGAADSWSEERLNKPAHEHTTMTVKQVIYGLMKTAAGNIRKGPMDELLKVIKAAMPQPNGLPRCE